MSERPVKDARVATVPFGHPHPGDGRRVLHVVDVERPAEELRDAPDRPVFTGDAGRGEGERTEVDDGSAREADVPRAAAAQEDDALVSREDADAAGGGQRDGLREVDQPGGEPAGGGVELHQRGDGAARLGERRRAVGQGVERPGGEVAHQGVVGASQGLAHEGLEVEAAGAGVAGVEEAAAGDGDAAAVVAGDHLVLDGAAVGGRERHLKRRPGDHSPDAAPGRAARPGGAGPAAHPAVGGVGLGVDAGTGAALGERRYASRPCIDNACVEWGCANVARSTDIGRLAEVFVPDRNISQPSDVGKVDDSCIKLACVVTFNVDTHDCVLQGCNIV
jgi:hypothetical protein